MQRLEELLQRGKIAKHVKDDIAIKAWATTFPDEKACYTFADPFIRLGRSEKNLSYIEKVAQSVKMLDISLDGVVTGRGSSYGPGGYLVSDFDFIMSHSVEEIIEDMQQHSKHPHGIRAKDSLGSLNGAPFFLLFNLENETTSIYLRPNLAKVPSEDSIKEFFEQPFSSDLIVPFSILPAFPVYNVNKIVVVDYDNVRADEYTAEGAEEVFLFENFFSR